MTIKQLIQSAINITPSEVITTNLNTDLPPAFCRANMLGTNTSDPASSGEDIYLEKQNLPTAMASILNHIQKKGNFYPTTQTPIELAITYGTFLELLDAFPVFGTIETKNYNQTFSSKSYNLLLDQVISIFSDLSPEDLNELKISLADMGKSIFGSSNSATAYKLFIMFTLNMNNLSQPYLIVYYATFKMKHGKDGKDEINKQTYNITKTIFPILTDIIRANAKEFAAIDKRTVDEWIANATSPEKKNAQLCFTVAPIKL